MVMVHAYLIQVWLCLVLAGLSLRTHPESYTNRRRLSANEFGSNTKADFEPGLTHNIFKACEAE